MVAGDRLVTPPADGRLLAGTTRRRALDLGEHEVRPFSLDDLRAADGIVLTSAIRIAVAGSLTATGPSAAALDLAAALRWRLGQKLLRPAESMETQAFRGDQLDRA
jgi:branched-subunit amino acid aminotransferase/4-amino-4-deoxychorismate lyase